MSTDTVEAPSSRRDRMRQATIEEMRETGRRILVEEGEAAVTMSAVAKAMDMTAPALYRYVGSHQELLAGVAVLCNTEVVAAMEAARDAEPEGDYARRIVAVSRAFRRWALAHPREFALVFASPEMSHACELPELAEASLRFGWVFGELFMNLVAHQGGRAWPDDEVDEAFLDQQSDLLTSLEPLISLGARWQFVNYWSQIFGTVSIEVFGHLDWALSDSEAVFERMLRGIAVDLGMGEEYVRPEGPATQDRG